MGQRKIALDPNGKAQSVAEIPRVPLRIGVTSESD